jgi:hypothetical protein
VVESSLALFFETDAPNSQQSVRERLYFARNARSRVPAAVLGTTYIYIKLRYSSMKDVHIGNNFITLLQQQVKAPLRKLNSLKKPTDRTMNGWRTRFVRNP